MAEVILWKVEDIPSGPNTLKPNDLYVEAHLGENEPSRTRVHNNAGSSCTLRQTFQKNIDKNDPEEPMYLHVKDSALVGNTKLAECKITTQQIIEIYKQTGYVNADYQFGQPSDFVQKKLEPSGSIWLRVNILQDDEDQRPLIDESRGWC